MLFKRWRNPPRSRRIRQLEATEFRSRSEFLKDVALSRTAKLIDDFERELVARHPGSAFHISGYCIACDRPTEFLVDYECSDGKFPNFRERVVCPRCSLNSRARASLHLALKELAGNAKIYITEQVTSLFCEVQRCFPATVGSEFFGDDTSLGTVNADGIRNEDMTRLQFADSSFDAVLSFECLEHIPDFRAALRETRRVLKPGGALILTAPFRIDLDLTLVRAAIADDGSIRHFEPPEFHGDPVGGDGGILCYYHFGWDILSDMRIAGFSEALVVTCPSIDFGYLGGLQPILIGRA